MTLPFAAPWGYGAWLAHLGLASSIDQLPLVSDRHEIRKVEHICKPSVQPADVHNCGLMHVDHAVNAGIPKDPVQPCGAELVRRGVVAHGQTGPRCSLLVGGT